MGYNDNDRTPIFVDVETCAIAGVEDFLEPVSAPSNYVKPEAIASFIEKAKAEQVSKAALDVDLARIVALGTLEGDQLDIEIYKTEDDERIGLKHFWERIRPYPYPKLIGFNAVLFDFPMMLRRSLYLGVAAPPLQLGKYKHPDVVDLMLLLSMDGNLKYRGLSFYTKRFGLPATDGKGSEVPGLVAAGDWGAVEQHLRADLGATAALAARVL